MCGILGRFSWTGRVDADDVLPDLVDLLAHRGPDEGAFWRDEAFFLGHRRLSIIDLSGGAQPMASADGSLVVTFNGEIYNYPAVRDELKSKGCRFRTSSDTEVLLHGYREWGVDLPSHLVGMFAFAIADRGRNELYLARDRFGEKPLLYAEDEGAVTFASELRPLAALPGRTRRMNEPALGEYLCLNYVPGTDTLLAGVQRVAPGTWRLYSTRGAQSGTFWAPTARPLRDAMALEPALSELRAVLDEAVRLALVSDVPVGIFLSGGMDSSLIAESAARQGRLSHAYCLDFGEEGYSEWPQAKRVADRLGLPITRVPFSHESLQHFLTIVEHADDPLADSSLKSFGSVHAALISHSDAGRTRFVESYTTDTRRARKFVGRARTVFLLEFRAP
jgi:asparagine synthase (glutamine-hydrolysing)